MSYLLGPHILYSRKATQLAQFLSEILDLEIMASNPSEGRILLKGESISFQVIQISAQKLPPVDGERDTILTFEVEELSHLNDLLHKVQFMSYRNGDPTALNPDKKAILHHEGGEHFFFLKDLDGRRWKFSYFSKT